MKIIKESNSMIDRRIKNAEIFRDTEQCYTTNQVLRQVVETSTETQIFIPEKSTVCLHALCKTEKARVIVSGKRSLEAAENYAKQGKQVCVLNFASATNPGGGVVSGSSAQEECICRCTTLYPCLSTKMMWDVFYAPHRQTASPLHNDDCIYTPNICVFKSDTNFPEPLLQEKWWSVNILTCAAPNLRERPNNRMNPYAGDTATKITHEELEELLTTRIRRIFEIAAANKNEILILGAFGCGAFRNPPEITAKVFNKVMKDYLCYFDTIEYAVYHTERELANYEAFQKIIES
jgi:TIGR02452 family protein